MYNQELSDQLAIEIPAIPKECYKNAALGAVRLGSPALYVEGFILLPDRLRFVGPLGHGWINLNGEIVDPTLAALGDDISTIQYYPALAFESKLVWGWAGKSLPILSPSDPEWMYAHLDASRAYDRWIQETHV